MNRQDAKTPKEKGEKEVWNTKRRRGEGWGVNPTILLLFFSSCSNPIFLLASWRLGG
jgi:hypothetical protein